MNLTNFKGTKITDKIIIKKYNNKNFELKKYVIFEDYWINKYDKFLYNKSKKIFKILDFITIEKARISPYKGFERYSCLLLDKPVKIGDIMYVL